MYKIGAYISCANKIKTYKIGPTILPAFLLNGRVF